MACCARMPAPIRALQFDRLSALVLAMFDRYPAPGCAQ